MGLFTGGKSKTGKARATRVVATGKRVKGSWVMESLLSPKAQPTKTGHSNLVGENRRVRTLH